MNTELKAKVDLMIENFEELKRELTWDSNLLKHFCAMMYATRGKKVNADKLKEIKKYISQETSVISEYRGNNKLIIAALLSFEEDYKNFFENMLEVHKKMKTEGFKYSAYLPLAVYTIAKNVAREDLDYKIQRMHEFYKKMKENHFWLTSADDYVFAAVLAVTELEVDVTMQKVEECYKVLNEDGFYKGNDLQTLSHIIALGEEATEAKCTKAALLYNKIKEQKCSLKYTGLATLGVLTLIASDEDKLVNDIKEVYDFIYTKSGYGMWSLEKYTRTILAANLVSDFYVDEMKKGVMQITLANSINAILIAQQQAACCAAAAAASAAASSSSS
jgi:PP-loop superfamily ATP-utilizing enzyme